MINIIITTFYFLLPAYLANMAPPIFAKIDWLKFFNKPVDNGLKLGNDYLFGSNKTWRGLLVATISGIITAGIQALLYRNFYFFNNISLINYPRYWLIFGFCAGWGAILGDLIKSFFKRRLRIKSGNSWPIFDQLDFIIGFFVATYWIANPNWQIILVAILITLILHPLTNIIAYFLNLKKVWW